MSDLGPQSWDPDPEAGEALRSAVETYGASVLSNPKVLSNLFKDLLPDSPRQAFLLVTAAESDVAGALEQRLGQRVDPTSALRAVATALSENWSIEPPAALWATTEFARALGYPLAPGPVGPVSPPVPAGEEATLAPTVGSPPTSGRDAYDGPPTVIAPVPAGVGPAATGPAGPVRSRRRPVLLAVVLALLVVLGVAVAVVLTRGGSKGNQADGGAPPGSRLVFADTFHDPRSGWAPDTNQSGAGAAAYVSGAYRLTALRPNPPYNTFSAHSPYLARLPSLAVTVDATIEPGEPADGAGVRCDQGSRSGLRYTFEVHRDGSWTIFQLGEPGPNALLQGKGRSVRLGALPNTITGECTEVTGGTRLTMTVNGQLLGSVVNPHAHGPIAWHAALVIYRSQPSPATVVRFTDFRTYRLPAS